MPGRASSWNKNFEQRDQHIGYQHKIRYQTDDNDALRRCVCALSLVCPSIGSHRTCKFWASNEYVNMPKTIESPAKCEVRRFRELTLKVRETSHCKQKLLTGDFLESPDPLVEQDHWLTLVCFPVLLHHEHLYVLYHCCTLLSLMKVSPYTLLILRLISAALLPYA